MKLEHKSWRGSVDFRILNAQGELVREVTYVVNSDTFPSASYLPTARDIYERFNDSGQCLTLKQAREIKVTLRNQCHWF